MGLPWILWWELPKVVRPLVPNGSLHNILRCVSSNFGQLSYTYLDPLGCRVAVDRTRLIVSRAAVWLFLLFEGARRPNPTQQRWGGMEGKDVLSTVRTPDVCPVWKLYTTPDYAGPPLPVWLRCLSLRPGAPPA